MVVIIKNAPHLGEQKNYRKFAMISFYKKIIALGKSKSPLD